MYLLTLWAAEWQGHNKYIWAVDHFLYDLLVAGLSIRARPESRRVHAGP